MFGRTGENHPRFGLIHSEDTRTKMSLARGGNSISLISVDDKIIIETFSSANVAAKYFSCSHKTILSYARSGKVFKGKYI